MIHIDSVIIEPLIAEAKSSPRKRKNYNFHHNLSERIHRMLHAMEPETYVQPHKHENPDKLEVFIILKGKVVVIEFDDSGEITDWLLLNPLTGNFGMEVEPKTWHSIICLENNSVIYEIKDGPWNKDTDKNFASWAPKEGEINCGLYNKKILDKLNLL